MIIDTQLSKLVSRKRITLFPNIRIFGIRSTYLYLRRYRKYILNGNVGRILRPDHASYILLTFANPLPHKEHFSREISI